MTTRRQQTVGQITLSYLQSGRNENTILFLHGSGMSANNWLPQLNDESLSERYSLIALDLPGHGQSGWLRDDPESYRPGGMAELLSSFLTEAKIENYLLAGLSFGTNVIGEMAQPLPGCKGLVLTSPCIINNQTLPSDVITAGPYGHVIATPEPSEEDVRAYIASHYCPPPLAEQYIRDFRATDPRFREQLGQLMVTAGWSDELANVQRWNLPVCVVFGKEDTLLKTDYLDGFTPLWNNRVYQVADAGHFVNEEQPEAFNRVLLQYAEERFK